MYCKYPVETSRLVLYPSLYPMSMDIRAGSLGHECGSLSVAEVRGTLWNAGYSNNTVFLWCDTARSSVLIPAVPWVWGTSELCHWPHANSTQKKMLRLIAATAVTDMKFKPSFVAFQQVYDAMVFSFHYWKRLHLSTASCLISHPILS